MAAWSHGERRFRRSPFGWRGGVLASLMGLLFGACGPNDASVDEASVTDSGRIVVRPGDGLIDLLSLSQWAVAPGLALPDALLQTVARGLVMRSPIVPATAWVRVPAGEVPAVWGELMTEQGGGALWRAASPLPSLPLERPHRVFVDGQFQAEWNPGDERPMPSPFVTWDPPHGVLLCVGASPPSRVEFDIAVDPVAELGGLGQVAAPPASRLARHELGSVSRPALLLPPPGSIGFAIDELQAERLEVSLGLLNIGWAITPEGVVHRAQGLSDGATFAVDVITEDGVVTRAWSRFVPAEAVGGDWIDDVVDLTPWRGRNLILRLVSDAGPGANDAFDWCLWGGLRLRGQTTVVPERPHVVLIDIDTLRADRFGAAMPKLAAWAEREAVVFEDARSTAPWTLPATASLMTGLAVHQHGVQLGSQALGEGLASLPERLARIGYETRAVAAGGYLRPAFGFDRGFERFQSVEPTSLDWNAELAHIARRDSERPLFLFLHTYRVHAPYPFDAQHASPGYDGPLAGSDVDHESVIMPFRQGELSLDGADGRYVASLYDGLVTGMDDAVAEFVTNLQRELDGQPVLIVLTSDHGEAFLEHGLLEHGQDLWNELLDVPLVVRFPDGRAARRDDPVSLLDVVPTVLDVVGAKADPTLPGHSLAAPVPADRVRVAFHQESSRMRAAEASGFKLIERVVPGGTGAPVTELYDLARDPGELNDVSADLSERTAQLLKLLEAWQAQHAPPMTGVGSSDLDGDARDQLRALGYLGDG